MADYGAQSDTLDAAQAVKAAYDKEAIAHRVIALNGLVPEKFDEIVLAYIAVGDGTGQVGLVTYKLAGSTTAVLSLTYDSYGGSGASTNRLIDVVRL